MATNLLAPKSVNMLRRSGEGPELRQQYPKFYGLLGGLLGTAPDEFEGSAMDPLTAQVRQGAKFGYPVGTAAAVIPFGGGIAAGKGVAQGGKAAQKGIVKLPGGQWLTGQTGIEKSVTNVNGVGGSPEIKAWLNTVGKNYIQNKMATADDPLRELANKGIVADEVAIQLTKKPLPDKYTKIARAMAIDTGFPAGKATDIKTPQAAWWDDVADSEIRTVPASSVRSNEPWLAKVAPDTPIHSMTQDRNANEGVSGVMRNITAQLQRDLDAGLIRPEQLSKISMPDAVTRTHQGLIKKIAAQDDIEKTALVHKEYPTGDKWVELGPLPDAPKNAKSDFRLKKLLGNEGKRMQNCVGDYCKQVTKGTSKIYSLRDAKGEPHVTVEVHPPTHNYAKRYSELSPAELADLSHAISTNKRGSANQVIGISAGQINPTDIITFSKEGQYGINVMGKDRNIGDYIHRYMKPSISQIRGKNNTTKIKPEYRSLTDDFIGDPAQWGSITE